MEPVLDASDENPHSYEADTSNQESSLQHSAVFPQSDHVNQEGYGNQQRAAVNREEYFKVLDEMKTKNSTDDIEKDTSIHDGNTSCLATCTTSDVDEDILKTSFSYEAEEGGDDGQGCLTSCVGTRWFRAPELLYGSIDYGLEVDLWSLGCIFAELLTLEPLFPGTADIDQLSRIINVVGNLNEETCPGCSKLPDYRTISFTEVENPIGLEACLPNRSPDEVSLVKKLLSYDPARRSTAMELLNDKYFNEEPLPVPMSQLRVPLTRNGQDEDSPSGWNDYNVIDSDSDSDFDEFGPMNITRTGTGFSIQFP